MSLQEIKEKAIELKNLRSEKESLNAHLKAVNEGIRELEEHVISSQMDDMGIADVTVDNVRIKRGVVFRGGVTSHTDKEAFQYLFDSNNEGALKQKLIVDLSQYPDLPDILTRLGVAFEINYSIHHMTLSSILKELFSEGMLSTDDFEKYSIYAQPQVKVEMKNGEM